MNNGVYLIAGVFVAIILIFVGGIGEIGANNVEYKGTYSDKPLGVGANNIETKNTQRSVVQDDISTNKPETKETQKVYDGSIEGFHVYNTSMSGTQIATVYHTNGPSGSTAIYQSSDLNDVMSGTFTAALGATTSWIDLMVLLAIVGIALSMVMGIMFRVSRILML